MQHLTVVRSIALSALVILASACGSDPTGPDFDGTFTEGQGTYAGSLLVMTIGQALPTMTLGDPLSGRVGFSAAPSRGVLRAGAGSRLLLPAPGVGTRAYLSQLQATAPGCTISGHGSDEDQYDPYDGNDNGIADDFALKIECTDVDSAGEGVTITYKQRYDLRMKERLGVDWGFDASLELWSSEKRSDEAAAEEEGYDLTEKLVVDNGKATYHETVSSWGKGLDGTDPYAYDDGGDVTLTFTSDGDPLVLHQDLPSGKMTATGRTYFTELGDANLEWMISTSAPLTYSPACNDDWNQPFVAGELSGALSGSTSKRFTAAANPCESPSPWTISATGMEAP